jgi:glycosyltransferase involved in cell wall biosynthesis
VDNIICPSAREEPRTGSIANVTVAVPTYRRVADLMRCLRGVDVQTERADEVIVVVRDTDSETWAALAHFEVTRSSLRIVTVREPGVVAALNVALAETRTSLIAITDDDAVPHPTWLSRIVAHFVADERVGAVGGRDHIRMNGVPLDGRAERVGYVPRIGRFYGNHHIGYGAARDVQMLKGVNSAYRVAALREIGFDTRLRGSGAQVHCDMAATLALYDRGWRVVYDPAIGVDHFPSARFDEDQRARFNGVARRNESFNETLIRLERLARAEQIAFMVWGLFIGTRAVRGLIQWLRFLPSDPVLSTRWFAASVRGRLEALMFVWSTRTGRNRWGESFAPRRGDVARGPSARR